MKNRLLGASIGVKIGPQMGPKSGCLGITTSVQVPGVICHQTLSGKYHKIVKRVTKCRQILPAHDCGVAMIGLIAGYFAKDVPISRTREVPDD